MKIPDCKQCKNYPSRCYYIKPFTGIWCPGIELIANNNTEPTEEPYYSIGDSDPFLARDYKEILSALSGTKEAIRNQWHDNIKEMPFSKIKVITSLLYFGIKATDIMKLLKLPRETFYRLFRRGTL